MITVLNDLVIKEIKAEMRSREVSQFELALRLGWQPAFLQRRLSGKVPLSITDVEQISAALGISLLELRRPIRRVS